MGCKHTFLPTTVRHVQTRKGKEYPDIIIAWVCKKCAYLVECEVDEHPNNRLEGG